MQTVLIVIHLMIVIALIAVILLQRSEGGGLGIGGGGGGGGGAGGMFSARGSANLLTRLTTGLAIAFFATALLLGILAKQQQGAPSILDGSGGGTPGQTAPVGGPDLAPGETLLDTLGGSSGGSDAPAPPVDGAPATAPNQDTSTPSVPGSPSSPQIPTGQ